LLFADGIIVCIHNAKESTDKLSKIKKFRKFAENKINIQKMIRFYLTVIGK
jgi:hypothetical protein